MPTAQWAWYGDPDSPDLSGLSYDVGSLNSLGWNTAAGYILADGISSNSDGIASSGSATWESLFSIPASSTITDVEVTLFRNRYDQSSASQSFTVAKGLTNLLTRTPTASFVDSAGSKTAITPAASSAVCGINVTFAAGTGDLALQAMTVVATYTQNVASSRPPIRRRALFGTLV